MKSIENIKLDLSFTQKKVIEFSQSYMQKMTKKFLDFQYTDEKITPPKPNKNKTYLLYLHVPFCQTLCPYCSFHRFKFKEDKTRDYFRLLRKEIKMAKDRGFDFTSLYIGGGTTTIIPDELVKTIEYAKELFDIKEVTCEADPLIDDDFVQLLSPHITRLSIGLQTTDDDTLKKLKRYKKFGSAKEQIENIKKAIGHFPVVNVDLIFNLPNQTKEHLQQDIEVVQKELGPDQISYYPLMYSPSVKKVMERNMGMIHNDSEIEFYETIMQSLSEDYRQLSAWSFGKQDVETLDEYVVEYNEYLGLGSGSFSFIDDTLYINTFSLKEYKQKVENDEFSLERYSQYKLNDMLKYQMMLDFFANNFNPKKYKDNYGVDVSKKFRLEFILLRLLGVLEKDSYKCTTYGRYLFLVLMKEFYIGMDFVREKSRKHIAKCDSL